MSPARWLPANLVGSESSVRADFRARARAFLGGGPWMPFDAEQVDSDALVVLSPMPLLAAEPLVRGHLPLAPLVEAITADRLTTEREETAVAASLESPAGVLGLLAPPNQLLLYAAERHRPFVDAVIRWWGELDGLGPRYTLGSTDGARLWDLPTNLSYVLAKLGVPHERLRAPLPPAGVAGLLS